MGRYLVDLPEGSVIAGSLPGDQRLDEIPSERALCLGRPSPGDRPRPGNFAPIAADAIWMDRPNVHFRFSSFDNGFPANPPLLERLRNGNRHASARVLRSRRRDLPSGEKGEEHLERVKEDNGTEGHIFIWEANGLANDPCDHLQVRLDMSTGNGKHGPENSNLSDEDALKLWDAIVNSIRLRPSLR